MPDKVAIQVEHVSKNFVLPHQRANSIKSLFTGLAKGRGNKSTETQHALDSISFEIKKGEFFGIVGRNGSGKSTMLKILAGIYQPTKGQVATHGKLVPFIELGVGFNPELTGRENVFLNGAMLGFSHKQIEIMYNDIVAFAELERFMDQKLKNYSSGMQVRLAFSMATRAEADILLVDEVLAVGDSDFQRKCFEYFRKLKKNKKTVVFVTHDMNAVREYCDRAILIDKSQIKFAGDADDVAKEYIRLFNPALHKQLEADTNNTSNDKWGAGTVDIYNLKVSKKIFDNSDEDIKITMSVKALRDFQESIVPGITIKNDAGQPVCGTNSKIIQVKIPKLLKGQVKTFTWAVPNIFNEGNFTVEPAVADGEDMSLCQWWDNAASFQVINEEKTPYPVAPKITLYAE